MLRFPTQSMHATVQNLIPKALFLNFFWYPLHPWNFNMQPDSKVEISFSNLGPLPGADLIMEVKYAQ